MGPVYALRWSPFRPNMWASASADWTLRLWQEGRQSALLTFQSGSHEVRVCVCVCALVPSCMRVCARPRAHTQSLNKQCAVEVKACHVCVYVCVCVTQVNDVQWCPTNSTVFGSVTSGGRLEVSYTHTHKHAHTDTHMAFVCVFVHNADIRRRGALVDLVCVSVQETRTQLTLCVCAMTGVGLWSVHSQASDHTQGRHCPVMSTVLT